MTTPLRDALTQQINQVGPAHPDIDELVGLGEQRLRRHRLTAVAGTVAAVVVAIALAVGGTALNRSADQGPVHHGPKHPQKTQTTTLTAPRPIVYSDVTFGSANGPDLFGDPIHVGDREVDTGSGFVPMDVTDGGVVYTTGEARDQRVWFTDGGTPEQIGSQACVAPHFAANTVVTGNSGSLAVWFDCSRAQGSELVVYDTRTGHEVARRGIKGCGMGYAECYADAIIGDHVYITWLHGGGDTLSGLEFDIASGRVSNVKVAADALLIPGSPDQAAQAYLDEVRSHPRGLVVGDSWETGLPTPSGFGVGFQFAVVGRRLVPAVDGRLTSAFDTATGRPIHLHLPAGYRPDPAEVDDGGFGLFQWLDDDTVALENLRTGRHDQDILTCRLSTGRCELAVPSLGRDRAYRVVQNENLGIVTFE